MAEPLRGKRVAILVNDGFERSELEENHTDWGKAVPIDVELERADPSRDDALLLPGGVMAPDAPRTSRGAVTFVHSFVSAKSIAAICHEPWTLINAVGVRGRQMTSCPSLQRDIENAGAKWVHQEVDVDHELATSRKSADLPAFNRKMMEEIADGRHERSAPASRG